MSSPNYRDVPILWDLLQSKTFFHNQVSFVRLYNYIKFIVVVLGSKQKRCGKCSGCNSKDCGQCKYCLDKKKFGGPNRLKQCCVKKRCTGLRKSAVTGMYTTNAMFT